MEENKTRVEQDSMPTSQSARTMGFVTTGVKVGVNYLKHYARKAIDPSTPDEKLHNDNAADIYDGLSKLKGSALKVAQMLSLDKNLLPTAYQNKFALAQYSVPPISFPLVFKTFTDSVGKAPSLLFDTFSPNAVAAASIGQVHKATKNNQTFAVKVQYPGVAQSINADLKMVKPFATRMFNASAAEIDYYLQEVECKLMEETDYELELKRGQQIADKLEQSGIERLRFPKYYPEMSGKKVLTMEWMEGMHLKEFLETNPSQQLKNQIGQTLWDFYHYQFHELRMVHADPHPGNFLFDASGYVSVIDFGCIKEIPAEYYYPYFKLLEPGVLNDKALVTDLFEQLMFINPNDTPDERLFYTRTFTDMAGLLGKPFMQDTFDFANPSYFEEIYQMGESLSKMPEYRNSKQARGSRHGLYVNRTYFGLYQMLHDLNATITIKQHTINKRLAV